MDSFLQNLPMRFVRRCRCLWMADLMVCVFLCVEGYLSRVLRNYTEQACDGEFLTVRCPPRTSITVQSASYRITDSADSPQCPNPYSSAGPPSVHDITSCHVSTSLQVNIHKRNREIESLHHPVNSSVNLLLFLDCYTNFFNI